ncbi:UNVERIFIED_CONTAM: Kinesin-like protein KIN-4C [Sesamum calycinum]|uniref:Kinesin-like protein KIN-4C n=1 Tax=Sesamum calycinum TaxID=2727403 RepID=A0AAW2QLQ6_9LAMI
MSRRAKMGEEVARLKEEALIGKQQNLSEFPQSMSPGARNSRIFALENMLATSSSTLVSMASQLSEAEERERAFSGRGRWNQVRSVAEAKNIMNFLFNLAASSRCQLRDREVDCREKDAEIRDLKEKVVNLVRQVELQKSELGRQENLVKLALQRHAKEMKEACGTCVMNNSDGHAYDLRPKGSLSSSILNSGVYAFELEDMDTSDDDQREHPRLLDDEDREWVRTKEKKKRQAKKRNSKTDSHVETAVDLEHLVVATSVEPVCCSCSKSSSCKTSRCECRAASGNCTPSCGCGPTKCSNREEVIGKELLHPETAGNMLDTDETERSKNLASHGAMLLQTAMSDKPVNTNDGGVIRKPLSDIGNNLANASVPKPNLRKKWRKSVIQLVPATPIESQAQNVDVPEQAKSNGEIDIPLKLPRAMRSTLTSNNQLKERNSDQPNESVNNEVQKFALLVLILVEDLVSRQQVMMDTPIGYNSAFWYVDTTLSMIGSMKGGSGSPPCASTSKVLVVARTMLAATVFEFQNRSCRATKMQTACGSLIVLAQPAFAYPRRVAGSLGMFIVSWHGKYKDLISDLIPLRRTPFLDLHRLSHGGLSGGFSKIGGSNRGGKWGSKLSGEFLLKNGYFRFWDSGVCCRGVLAVS